MRRQTELILGVNKRVTVFPDGTVELRRVYRKRPERGGYANLGPEQTVESITLSAQEWNQVKAFVMSED